MFASPSPLSSYLCCSRSSNSLCKIWSQFFDDDQSDDTDEYATTEGFDTELQLLAQKAQSFLGGDQHLMASAHDMSFALADALPAPQGQKIRWLKSTRTADRLNEAMEFLSNYRRE